MLAIMHTLFKFMLKSGTISVFAFMIMCTVFVVICVIRGDIKISITRNETKKENK